MFQFKSYPHNHPLSNTTLSNTTLSPAAPSASFGTSSGLQYELSRSRRSLADKLTMTFKPDTLSAR